MDDVEFQLKKLYVDFTKMKQNNIQLVEERNAAVEEKCVLETAYFALQNEKATSGELDLSTPLLGGDVLGASFNTIAGVLSRADQDRFARTIFRAARGNAFTHFHAIPEPLQDPKTSKAIRKTAFAIYFQDVKSSTSAIRERIKKICLAFAVNLYRWPASRREAEDRRCAVLKDVEDKENALSAFQKLMEKEIQTLVNVQRGTGNSLVEEYRLFVVKEKAIYHTMNMMEGEINLMAQCWYPEDEEDMIKSVLQKESKSTGCSAMLLADKGGHSSGRAPTYIKSNQFLAPFQELINTYGIPKYKEANPACLYSVTFPFMFGIMYGDVGHGTMLFLVGLYLVFKGEALKFSAPDIYNARYFVAMMGFYAIFAGLMYNDFFSLGLDLFGSRWVVDREQGGSVYFKADYDIKNDGGPGPYPFGIDPAWHGTSNELLFINSLKMKISVLIGVAQMLVGVGLRFSNGFFYGIKTDVICECVPMLAFMICFFAYMDFMILYKWVTPMETAPSIINSLICMAMGQKDTAPLWDGSIALEKNLMMITMLSVPIMLIPKPIILWIQSKGSKQDDHHALEEEEEESGGGHGHGGEFKLDEIVIHQIIETIEYVLGTVSHTASYLRLWALSLAHQQLSLVFFQKTILAGLAMDFPANGIFLYFMYGAWFGITVGVLLGMDVLECFLHDLRLHWVEFQSKFYNVGGDGHMFAPYKQSAVLEPKGD